MSDLPLVSVIIPTYNYGHLIDETLHSLYAQTYDHWEAIVVDDGSTDNTAAVVHEHMGKDRRIKFYQQENRKQAVARNLGLHHCSGQYVLFLDADDLIEPRKLEVQVALLEQHPEVDIVYGSVRYFKSKTSADGLGIEWAEVDSRVPAVRSGGREVLYLLIRNNFMPTNAPLARRRVIDEVGPFDELLPPAEDWDYWIRCAILGKYFHYDDSEGSLALRRLHPDSSSSNPKAMLSSALRVRQKIAATVSDAEFLSLNWEMSACLEAWLGMEETAHGSPGKGMRRLWRAAVMSRHLRRKMKWVLCGVVAPFMRGERLKRFATTSLTGLLRWSPLGGGKKGVVTE